MEDVTDTISSSSSSEHPNKRRPEGEEADKSGDESSTSEKKKKTPVWAYTIQCADCLKWRVMPTKKKYEQIRAGILEEAFTCSKAMLWKLRLSCDDPLEISPDDGKSIWTVDQPGIPLPPSGWSREVVVNDQEGTRFADVCYKAPPKGKELRSEPQVREYLKENLEFAAQGLTEEDFSFSAPEPLDPNYCRKQFKAPETSASQAGTCETEDRSSAP